jgi:hypothetical protein
VRDQKTLAAFLFVLFIGVAFFVKVFKGPELKRKAQIVNMNSAKTVNNEPVVGDLGLSFDEQGEPSLKGFSIKPVELYENEKETTFYKKTKLSDGRIIIVEEVKKGKRIIFRRCKMIFGRTGDLSKKNSSESYLEVTLGGYPVGRISNIGIGTTHYF